MNSNGKNTHLPNQEQQKSSCVTMPTDNCVIPVSIILELDGYRSILRACAILLSCQLRLFKVTCNLLSGKSTVLWNKKQRSFINQTKMQKEIINLFEDLISISLFDSALCC